MNTEEALNVLLKIYRDRYTRGTNAVAFLQQTASPPNSDMHRKKDSAP